MSNQELEKSIDDAVAKGSHIIESFKALPITLYVPGVMGDVVGTYNGFDNQVTLSDKDKLFCTEHYKQNVDFLQKEEVLVKIQLPNEDVLMFREKVNAGNVFDKLGKEAFETVNNVYLQEIGRTLSIDEVQKNITKLNR